MWQIRLRPRTSVRLSLTVSYFSFESTDVKLMGKINSRILELHHSTDWDATRRSCHDTAESSNIKNAERTGIRLFGERPPKSVCKKISQSQYGLLPPSPSSGTKITNKQDGLEWRRPPRSFFLLKKIRSWSASQSMRPKGAPLIVPSNLMALALYSLLYFVVVLDRTRSTVYPTPQSMLRFRPDARSNNSLNNENRFQGKLSIYGWKYWIFQNNSVTRFSWKTKNSRYRTWFKFQHSVEALA